MDLRSSYLSESFARWDLLICPGADGTNLLRKPASLGLQPVTPAPVFLPPPAHILEHPASLYFTISASGLHFHLSLLPVSEPSSCDQPPTEFHPSGGCASGHSQPWHKIRHSRMLCEGMSLMPLSFATGIPVTSCLRHHAPSRPQVGLPTRIYFVQLTIRLQKTSHYW